MKITKKNDKRMPNLWRESIQDFDPWKDSNDYYFDLSVARGICKFFKEYFSHSKGKFAGKPFILDDWQKKYVGHLFGWKHKKTNLRRFKKTLLYIPKKNGKTQLAAGLALILLLADGEAGAEVYCCAADVGQASILYNASVDMIDQNELLAEDTRVLKGYKVIEVELTKSILKVLSSKASTKHGPNVHGLIIDELHTQKDIDLIDTLEAGIVSRSQPLIINLTTADFAGPSICNEELDYAKKVRDNIIDDREYLPCVYETLRNEDWTKEEVWRKANPGYGKTVQASYFHNLVKKAKEKPSEANKFKRLHLNMQTETSERWLNMDDYDHCSKDFDLKLLEKAECFGAFDLSSSDDITAFTLYFPEYNVFLPHFWVPAETAKKRLEYEIWEQQGFLEITKGRRINNRHIRAYIKESHEKYNVIATAYDPWNATQIALELSEYDGFNLVEFRQGYKSFNEPSKQFEIMVTDHSVNHLNNPVLRWMASNCSREEDKAGNIKPIKPLTKNKLKVDGIITMVMCVGLSMMNHQEQENNVYNDRGLILL